MASLSSSLPLAFLAILIISPAAIYGTSGGRKVGGRTEVKDVESNKEVQELGLFAVREYNRRIHSDNSCAAGDQHRPLTFSRVAAAERQVVSGLIYYLHILAVHAGGGEESTQPLTFDAVVLIKPWLGVQELVRFAPATGGQTTRVNLKGF